MAAYAAAALALAWIPVLGAFAFAYALIVLMGIGIQSVYGTTFLTTFVTAGPAGSGAAAPNRPAGWATSSTPLQPRAMAAITISI